MLIKYFFKLILTVLYLQSGCYVRGEASGRRGGGGAGGGGGVLYQVVVGYISNI